jgi:hypothetical protein
MLSKISFLTPFISIFKFLSIQRIKFLKQFFPAGYPALELKVSQKEKIQKQILS